MNEEEKLAYEERLKQLRSQYDCLVQEAGNSRDNGYRLAVLSDLDNLRKQITELQALMENPEVSQKK